MFEVGLTRDASAVPEPGLFEQVRLRVTNRKLGPRQPLSEEDAAALATAARARGACLTLLSRPDQLEAAGDALGRGDRLRLLDRRLHEDWARDLRWTAEAAATRDGIDVATLELPPAGRAALRMVAGWPTASYLARCGGGQALEQSSRSAVAAASAIGLLTIAAGPTSYFQGGRALQRLWLTASGLDLALQPLVSILPVFFRGLEDRARGVWAEPPPGLDDLRRAYRRWFPMPAGHVEVMVFRVARAGPPTTRSLRRPLDEVFAVE
jgi:hypothetical protein